MAVVAIKSRQAYLLKVLRVGATLEATTLVSALALDVLKTTKSAMTYSQLEAALQLTEILQDYKSLLRDAIQILRNRDAIKFDATRQFMTARDVL